MTQVARKQAALASIDVSRQLWKRQFEVESDFPPAVVLRKLVICTTPRCGSHFLGHRMRAQGVFGYPLEYFNPGNWQVWQQRARLAGTENTLDFVKSVRTGPNGVFGTKLHHEHLESFLAHEPDPLGYAFVHLRRRDTMRQAISFARAQQTGAWISDMPEQGEARYDYDLIASKLEAITYGNAAWRAFLASLGISPVTLWYEDVADDPAGAMAQIADHLGVDLAEGRDGGPGARVFHPEVQRRGRGETEDWGARFRADTRRLLSARTAVPGYRPKPAGQLFGTRLRSAADGTLRRLGLRDGD